MSVLWESKCVLSRQNISSVQFRSVVLKVDGIGWFRGQKRRRQQMKGCSSHASTTTTCKQKSARARRRERLSKRHLKVTSMHMMEELSLAETPSILTTPTTA